LSAICVLLLGIVGTVAFAFLEVAPTGPNYPNATLLFSRAVGGEFARVRLLESRNPQVLISDADEIFLRPKGVRLVNRQKGTAVQIEWAFHYAGGGGDHYEFKITAPSGATSYEQVVIANYPIDLLKEAGLVVTIASTTAQ
jgi:hypothetical protein